MRKSSKVVLGVLGTVAAAGLVVTGVYYTISVNFGTAPAPSDFFYTPPAPPSPDTQVAALLPEGPQRIQVSRTMPDEDNGTSPARLLGEVSGVLELGKGLDFASCSYDLEVTNYDAVSGEAETFTLTKLPGQPASSSTGSYASAAPDFIIPVFWDYEVPGGLDSWCFLSAAPYVMSVDSAGNLTPDPARLVAAHNIEVSNMAAATAADLSSNPLEAAWLKAERIEAGVTDDPEQVMTMGAVYPYRSISKDGDKTTIVYSTTIRRLVRFSGDKSVGGGGMASQSRISLAAQPGR